MSIISADTIIEVPFFDLDPMNIVWHGNYIKYTEISRCTLLDKISYSYDEMKADGFMYPVAKMDMKFIKPATFGQKLIITASLEEFEPSLKIKYVIKNAETKETLFKASTMQICVNFITKTSIYTAPEKLKRGIECLKV